MIALVRQSIVALELGDDGVFQFGGAIYCGIPGQALANGLDARIRNGQRGVEVRLAGPQSNDVLAFRLELGGPGGDGEGRGGFNLLNALGKCYGQGNFLC